MNVQYISPLSDLEAELKPLFSNEYMLAFFKKFCDAIQSRMRRFKRGKNARYEADDFLGVFFYSEITGRSIRSASERLNRYFFSKKKGKRKIHIDGHAYYGKRDDKMIKGTNRQKGTKKMRHYLGFSILSRGIQLFVGLEHIAKGQSKIPVIIKFLDSILELGFELSFVIMDREFYRTELLDEIKGMKGDVLIPAKSYPKIKRMIEKYLRGTGNRVRKYTFSSATDAEYRFFQNVYLILNAKKGHSLLDVKRDFQRGILTLSEASKLIYTIMTTQKPRGESSSWASRTSRFYRKRWNIETGFSDLNRMGHRWKSKYDNTRYLDLLVRMLLYNSWKINRAHLEKCQKNPSQGQEWTLQDNQDALEEMFIEV